MGPFYCLTSAASFGLMAIFAKLTLAQGVQLDTLLLLRFGLAALVLLVLAQLRGAFKGLTRRAVLTALLMGGFGYAAQAGLYFAALQQAAASQVALIFCTYPLLVMVAAVVTRRERASLRRVIALLLALGGISMVLGGATSGSFDPVGALLAFGSAVVYCGYILVGDRVGVDMPPLAMTALVCAGAAATFVTASFLRGGPELALSRPAWGWVSLLVVVSTVGAILLFFAGLARVGPTVAALLGIIEPVVTIGSAAAVFGESMKLAQAIGGCVVLVAVLVIQLPSRRRFAHEGAAPPVPSHETCELSPA